MPMQLQARKENVYDAGSGLGCTGREAGLPRRVPSHAPSWTQRLLQSDGLHGVCKAVLQHFEIHKYHQITSRAHAYILQNLEVYRYTASPTDVSASQCCPTSEVQKGTS